MSRQQHLPDPIWPNQTELEKRLRGVQHHHDIWCNADRRKPMGTPGIGCSCKYTERRRERNEKDPYEL